MPPLFSVNKRAMETSLARVSSVGAGGAGPQGSPGGSPLLPALSWLGGAVAMGTGHHATEVAVATLCP